MVQGQNGPLLDREGVQDLPSHVHDLRGTREPWSEWSSTSIADPSFRTGSSSEVTLETEVSRTRSETSFSEIPRNRATSITVGSWPREG